MDLHAAAEDLDAFDHCYRLEVVGLGGLLRYQRIGLPGPGGVLDQPARLMDAFDEIERIGNDELAADSRDARDRVKDDGRR